MTNILPPERDELYQEDLRRADAAKMTLARLLQEAAFSYDSVRTAQLQMRGEFVSAPLYIRQARALMADKRLKAQVAMRLMQ